MCAVSISRGIWHLLHNPQETEGQYLSEPYSEVLKNFSKFMHMHILHTAHMYTHVCKNYICMQYT